MVGDKEKGSAKYEGGPEGNVKKRTSFHSYLVGRPTDASYWKLLRTQKKTTCQIKTSSERVCVPAKGALGELCLQLMSGEGRDRWVCFCSGCLACTGTTAGRGAAIGWVAAEGVPTMWGPRGRWGRRLSDFQEMYRGHQDEA